MTPEVERELVRGALRALSGESTLPEDMAKIARRTALLEEARLLLVDYADMIDGPDGQPIPNRELELINRIDRALGWDRE